jgi:uncharacterized membrane protein (DUF4010 family)
MLVEHFAPTDVAAKLAVSIGIGLLVGIEREWSNKDLGARTFALVSLSGMVAGTLGNAAVVTFSVGIFLIAIFANTRSLLADRSLEATTSVALFVIYLLGVLTGQGHLFTPVAAAILTTMLLAWKVELHRFAGGLQVSEIRSAVLLGLLGFVVYPALPNRFVDRWGLINPRQAWITVVVLAGIGFANYVLLKVYGKRGIYLSAFLGGLVNSSAAAVQLAKPLGAEGISGGTAIAALMLTIIAMFARNLFIVALFSPQAIVTAAAPLIIMAALALTFARRATQKDADAASEIRLESPVSLGRVLSFAALFLLIQTASTLSKRYLGDAGFLGASLVGGLISSASTSAAAANLVSHGQIQAGLAGDGVVLASVASALINLPIIHRNAHNPPLSRRLFAATLGFVVVGVLVLAGEQYVRMHFR